MLLELFVVLGLNLEGEDLGVWKEFFLFVLFLNEILFEGFLDNVFIVLLFLGEWYNVGDLLLVVNFWGENKVDGDLMCII